jgi:hypothetical protein
MSGAAEKRSGRRPQRAVRGRGRPNKRAPPVARVTTEEKPSIDIPAQPVITTVSPSKGRGRGRGMQSEMICVIML